MKKFLQTLSVALLLSSSLSRQSFAASGALTPEEQKILDGGEIRNGRFIAGGVIGTVFGLGIGHGVMGHGMYKDGGWIFTAGELGSLAVVFASASSCLDDVGNWRDACKGGQKTGIILGFMAFWGFRIWEIVDVWTAPEEYNDRYHAIQKRAGVTSYYLLPPTEGVDAWRLGLAARF